MAKRTWGSKMVSELLAVPGIDLVGPSSLVTLLENPPPIQPYAPDSWGPQPSLNHLTAPYRWHLPGAGSPS